MHEEYLLTTAEVAGALLGFVGVVLILNRRAEGVVSRQDQSGLFHLVYAAAGAMFFSLVMYAALASAQRLRRKAGAWPRGSVGLHPPAPP